MSNFWTDVVNNNLNVETCILELVKIALKRKASSIAVRFNPEKHKIQVVDNGIGFTKYELSNLFYNEEKNYVDQETIFDKINSSSNVVIVTSRSQYSPYTFVKVASENNKYKLFEGYHRPSKGTTVTIYDFNSSQWNNEDDKNCSISYMIAALAFMESKVSFSLRNDKENKVILHISKPHNPWEVLKYLKSTQTKQILYEFRSPTIMPKNIVNLDVEKCTQNEEISTVSPLIRQSNLFLINEINVTENSFYMSPFSEWSNWSYKPSNLDIDENDDKICSSSNQINAFDDSFINLSQMSVWSDWSYNPENSKSNNDRGSHFSFLPIALYKLLPYKCHQLINSQLKLQPTQFQSPNNSIIGDIFNKTLKYFNNVVNIRDCNMKRKLDECRISGNTINSLQILKQVNKEFIVAIANENGKKLLLMIDQHAVHERIRYEWLIENYREKESYKYFSVKLDQDLMISDIDKNLLKLIALHKKAVNRVGVHVKRIVDATTCIVDAVPKCFIRRVKSYNQDCNMYRLMKNVRQLLVEVAEGLAVSHSVLPPALPITINNVIASEACREAIKFGDPLSVKDCTLLIKALQDTKAPTRCAHGRPSVIPILDLTNVDARKFSDGKKLNFESLKNWIKMRKEKKCMP